MKKSTQHRIVIMLIGLIVVSCGIWGSAIYLLMTRTNSQQVTLNEATYVISKEQETENVKEVQEVRQEEVLVTEQEAIEEKSSSPKEEALLALIGELKQNQRSIAKMDTEITQNLFQRDKTQAYECAEQMIAYCKQILEVKDEAVNSEASAYVSCFKGYAQMGIKYAEEIMNSKGKITALSMDYQQAMSEFNAQIRDFEAPTLTQLIARKGMTEERNKIINKNLVGEDTQVLEEQFKEHLLQETDLAPFEKMLVEGL